MTKYLIPIGLTVASIANGTPCYTDTIDGCNNNPMAIYVKTKDTENGFCTEYVNAQKQKVARCYTTPEQPILDETTAINTKNQNKTQETKTVTKQIIYNNQTQQINNYNNTIDDSRDSDTGYLGGYWNSGYWNDYYNNNNYYNGGFYNHRPPPPHNRPHPRPPAATLPGRLPGKSSNTSQHRAAVPARQYSPSNRPNHPRPP